jgi:hypothetical protein
MHPKALKVKHLNAIPIIDASAAADLNEGVLELPAALTGK